MAFTKENPPTNPGRKKGSKNKSTDLLDQTIRAKSRTAILEIINDVNHKDRAVILKAMIPYVFIKEREELSELEQLEKELDIKRKQLEIEILSERVSTAEDTQVELTYTPLEKGQCN